MLSHNLGSLPSVERKSERTLCDRHGRSLPVTKSQVRSASSVSIREPPGLVVPCVPVQHADTSGSSGRSQSPIRRGAGVLEDPLCHDLP